MKLAVKLALGLMVATALVFSIFGWQLRNAQLRGAEQLTNASAERIGDIIRRGAHFQMLRNDREALYRMIRDIGSESGIRQIRILNKSGAISFSTNEGETNHVVDKTAEACYGCHAQAAPLEKLSRSDRARVFTSGEGERILGVILPIENHPDCSSAACHVHPAGKKVLGVIDVQLSLASADRQIAEQQSMLWRFTAVASAVLGGLCLLVIWWMVYRPLRTLVGGIRRVAGGNLEEKIPRQSQDEIGEVAEDFNAMTRQLLAARTEITEWNRTLEERSERKSRELERAHHTLLQSEKLASVGRLAATVAHEINNPLFGILTNARLARKHVERTDLSAEKKTDLTDKLGVIERESRRCGDIVKNLLMFSRQAPPKLEEVDPAEVVERAVALIRHTYAVQNLELHLTLGHAAARVRGDAGQLQQVLLVLLVNAQEAMPHGGHVWLETAGADGAVVITVRDDGPGIPAEVRDRIFEPFFTTKQDGPRTGLGLAIAAGIVEKHEGTIAVESEAGRGTQFTVRLPASARVEAQTR
jgi:two-component system NtrC family sensor kinase